MKRYLIDLVVGFCAGFIFFFGGHLIAGITYGAGGLVGFDTITKIFPLFANLIPFIGVIYIMLGIVPFLVYITTPWYRKHHKETSAKIILYSFCLFSLGIYLSFFAFLLVAAFAFSLTTGPF